MEMERISLFRAFGFLENFIEYNMSGEKDLFFENLKQDSTQLGQYPFPELNLHFGLARLMTRWGGATLRRVIKSLKANNYKTPNFYIDSFE